MWGTLFPGLWVGEEHLPRDGSSEGGIVLGDVVFDLGQGGDFGAENGGYAVDGVGGFWQEGGTDDAFDGWG